MQPRAGRKRDSEAAAKKTYSVGKMEKTRTSSKMQAMHCEYRDVDVVSIGQ